MRFEPCYKRPFATFVKKQHKPFQAVIEDAVDVICADPAIGEAKIGDLKAYLKADGWYKCA